jgi:hypothetical protein
LRKKLRLDIARTRERVDRAPLPAGHLGDDVAGGAETEDAEMLAFPGHYQRAPADQARAKQWCDRDVIARFTERKAVAGVRDEMGGKAAVTRVAGEARAVAKVLLAAPAIGTFAAGVTEPGNTDAFADFQGGDAGAKRVDPADHLMARNDRIGDIGQFSVNDMQIGPAHAAGADLDAHVARRGFRIVPPLEPERRTGCRQDHGVHLFVLTQACTAYQQRSCPDLIPVKGARSAAF